MKLEMRLYEKGKKTLVLSGDPTAIHSHLKNLLQNMTVGERITVKRVE